MFTLGESEVSMPAVAEETTRMQHAKEIPADTQVMAPLRDVLYRGVVVGPREDHPRGNGMVCVKFTPPIAMEPSGSINYITCPIGDITIGWF
jgi:hypothetical protein